MSEPGRKVSLVVPLRDEESSAGALLQSIAAQDRPPDELVVVDAGSTDRTADVVASFASTTGIPVRLVRAGPLHPGAARNLGVENAAHEWLAFTDGGIRLERGWLAALLDASAAAEVAFGSYEPVCDTWFTRAAAVAYVAPADGQGFRGPFVASMALTRAAFEAAGRFPRFRAAEDLVFLERLGSLPFGTVRVPAAVVHWQLAPDLRRTYRRFALYSEHNLRAGRGRDWHVGVLRHYAAMVVLTAIAWAAGAGAWSLAVYPAWQLVRATRSAWLKRGGLRFRTLDPRHVLLAAFLLCVIDLATLAGAVRWRVRGDGR